MKKVKGKEKGREKREREVSTTTAGTSSFYSQCRSAGHTGLALEN